MNRPAGVTVSAVFLIMVSLAAALAGAALFFVSSFFPSTQPQPPYDKTMTVFSVVVFLGCALWGLITVVGLLRMRRWARKGILLIGGLLVFFGVFLSVILLIAIRFQPEFWSAPESGPVLSFVIATYFAAIALGVCWLIYFSREQVKAAFLQGFVPDKGPRLPLSIAVIAWHAIGFGLGTLAFLVMGSAPYVFGIVLTGWVAALTNLLLAATELAIGVGLLKMKSWGHTAAVWFCVLAMMQALVGVFLSIEDTRVAGMIQILSFELNLDSTALLQWSYLVGPVVVWGTFGCALWFLYTRKKAFLEAGRASRAAA